MQDIRIGICPICDHREIIKAVPREFTENQVLRLAVAHGRGYGGLAQELAYGFLALFVCRSCGYSQLFAEDPAQIPIGADHETELIRGPEKQPYR
jgi:hypothetical protein